MAGIISSSILVGALLRLAESQGGFGVVIARGDSAAGAIAIILREKGGNPRFFERLLQSDGRYAWLEPLQPVENEQDLGGFLAKRKKFDPDLWIIELDIASSERFAAEMNSVC